MQSRYYDPSVGRFISVDPIQIIGGYIFSINRYDYGKDNPLYYVDRCGMAPSPPEEDTKEESI